MNDRIGDAKRRMEGAVKNLGGEFARACCATGHHEPREVEARDE